MSSAGFFCNYLLKKRRLTATTAVMTDNLIATGRLNRLRGKGDPVNAAPQIFYNIEVFTGTDDMPETVITDAARRIRDAETVQ